MDQKQLIYIMNYYSEKSTQHFYHILNLLKAMADEGVNIALIIEKCDDTPKIAYRNIEFYCQKQKGIFRILELIGILKTLVKKGYKKTFIRISTKAAAIAIIINKIYGGKTYYWQSGTTWEVDMNKPFFSKIKWLFNNYIIFYFVKHFTDYFVTGPETMVKYYAEIVKVSHQKIKLLYNDIDLSRFVPYSREDRLKLRCELGFGDKDCIILMVHRLSPVRKTDKYIPFIVENSKFFQHNVKLIIIGDGPERNDLERLISCSIAKEYICMIGSKPNNEIHKYYQIADIFINPSYTEGFPRVVIEAMACGVPVVATDAGGTVDIVGKKQKEFVINRNDVQLFSQKLMTLVANQELRCELAIENLMTVKKFSTHAVATQYIERIFGNG